MGKFFKVQCIPNVLNVCRAYVGHTSDIQNARIILTKGLKYVQHITPLAAVVHLIRRIYLEHMLKVSYSFVFHMHGFRLISSNVSGLTTEVF